jgi:hypothetical protein
MWSKFELVEKQARFWVLMAQGSTLTAACDAVRVNRRTGRRWRQATGGRTRDVDDCLQCLGNLGGWLLVIFLLFPTTMPRS